MITATFGASTWTGFLGKGLAPRELEATLLAAGDLTIKEIARRMEASPRTVEKRLESARFKLGAKTMRGLVLEAFRRGVISPAAALCLVLAVHACVGDDTSLRVRRGGTGGERRVELRMTARRMDDARLAA